MDKISDNVQYEFRIIDKNGTFFDVRLYQDDHDVVIEQGDQRLVISLDQFIDLNKCSNHLAIHMGIKNAS